MSSFNWNPEMRNLFGVNSNMGHRTRRKGPENDCNKDIDAIVTAKNMDDGEILSILEKLGLQTLYSQGIKQSANAPANTPSNAPENTQEGKSETKPETKTTTTPENVVANAPAETTETTETTAVEKVEKVDGVGESGSVSSSKWAGVVDEYDPVMWLQFMGWDDLKCLVDPDNPNGFVTKAGYVVADKYGKELANVLFDMETGEFSPEKAKAYMESKGIIQLAPGIFSVDKLEEHYNRETESYENVVVNRTIQIWDPEKHEFNTLCRASDNLYKGSSPYLKPGEGAIERWEKLKNNISSETYLDLRVQSDYMDNAMSKYLENGVFKLDGATCDFQVDDSFIDLYTEKASRSIRYQGENGKQLYIQEQAAQTDFGSLLDKIMAYYQVAKDGGLTDEQIQNALSNYSPTSASAYFSRSGIDPESAAYQAAYLAQEYMLLTGESSLTVMNAPSDINEISGYFGDKTKVHIDNVYETSNSYHYSKYDGCMIPSSVEQTYIALCGPQKGQNTIDALKEITKYEDNINWYAKENYGGAKGDMSDPSFAEDTTEWHKKILLEKGLTEEQIAETTLVTGTERIRDRMIKDFGIPENTFFEEDGKIYIDVDAWNKLFYEASVRNDGSYEKLEEMFSKMQLSTEHGDMKNYWENMAKELGSITGENGHTGISLSTYYKTQYKTTDALHRIYLSSVAAEKVGSGNDIKAIVKGDVVGALLKGEINGLSAKSIYVTYQGDNKEFFNTLLESYPEFRVIKNLVAPNASTLNELLAGDTSKLDDPKTWWNFIQEAGSYFNTDVYAIFYEWYQNNWRLEYGTQESNIKTWVSTHPEFSKYSDAKSVSELSFEDFKSFIDYYWSSCMTNAAVMATSPIKIWNLLDNYIREQGYYEMNPNNAHKIQNRTISGIQQTGITYNGNRPKFISNGTPSEEFKKKLQAGFGFGGYQEEYWSEYKLKDLDVIKPGVYGTTDENGNVKIVYYFDGSRMKSYDEALYYGTPVDNPSYVLKKALEDYTLTGDKTTLEAMMYLYMTLTNKNNLIVDLKTNQVIEGYYDYFNSNEFHY